MNFLNMAFIMVLSCLAALATSCNMANASEKPMISEKTEILKEAPDKVLRHVVVFKYKAEATESDIDKVNKAFANLKNEIPEIKAFEWGLNNSPEGFDQDFTHVYQLTFHSEEGRDIYLPHPAHKAFGALLGPYIDKVFVVDYWTE